jgi:hypothetical protein
MQQPLIPHRTVLALIASAIILPITICVVLAVAGLLQAMGDSVGGNVLRWVALGGGILWSVNLVCLILALAVGTLRGPGGPGEPK